MPKLLLQPVVENAIEHGLDEKEDGDKKIFLSFKGKGDDVEITVRDNGLGMEQEKAEMELLEKHNINFIVLARYMQVISEQMIEAYPNRIINIHHSFLPAFVGAKPYHAAF